MPVQGLVWTYQTTPIAMKVDEQIDRLRTISKDNVALSFPKTQPWMLMRSMMQPTLYYLEYVCSNNLRRHRFTRRQQEPGQWDTTTSWRAISCQQNVINQWWSIDGVSWNHEQPWAQEDIPKSSEMKLSCKFQRGSFPDYEDDWRITNKQRRRTLHHAIRGQRQPRMNLSLHLQWTPTRQPRINENHERLMEEEHAIVRILIEWCKDKA